MPNNLFGWSGQTWLIIDQWGILLGLLLAVATLGGGLFAFFQRDSIRRWLIRPLTTTPLDANAITNQFDGILFTVSRPELPEEVIRLTQPKAIGLLGSVQSSATMAAIAGFAKRQGITVYQDTLANPDDPAEASLKAQKLLERMKNQPLQRLAVDITGGKLPMSLGAFRAAEKQGLPALYATSQFDSDLRKPVPGTTRITQLDQ